MRTLTVALVVSLAASPVVAAEDLPTFLKGATAAARPNVPLRADGELLTTSPDGTTRDQLAMLRRPNGDVYIELRTAGIRALLLGNGKAFLVPGAGKSATDFALDASLGNSEFTREDLRPFAADSYRSPTIVDRNGDELSVSLTPHPSQYALEVITFNGSRHVPVVVKNYKDTVSNLIKMSRSTGLTSIGGTWMPSEIAMENFPLHATSTAKLRWQTTEDVPALFDPAALSKPSTLQWP
jgi:hypothetical protein